MSLLINLLMGIFKHCQNVGVLMSEICIVSASFFSLSASLDFPASSHFEGILSRKRVCNQPSSYCRESLLTQEDCGRIFVLLKAIPTEEFYNPAHSNYWAILFL